MTFQLSMYKENTYEAKDKEDINRKQ
jgi:hypothetical protein